MVTVPNIAPETPALKKNPVFVYTQDRFQKPAPFRPDIAVDISSVYDQKVHALDAHVSQVYEWLPWIGHYTEKVPADTVERKKWLHSFSAASISPAVRASLEKWYGKAAGSKAKYAEAFEICEYGTQPDEAEQKRLFPMLGKQVGVTRGDNAKKQVSLVFTGDEFADGGDYIARELKKKP